MTWSRPMSDADAFPPPHALADEIAAAHHALPRRRTEPVRAIRRANSLRLRAAEPAYVLAVARELVLAHGLRSIPYGLILYHKGALHRLDGANVEELGAGIDSWKSVDGFGRLLAGPAWVRGLVEDERVAAWALSDDLWWRRAALVSTVALNTKVSGGSGDTARTQAICRMLADDGEDMVVKALSWALRSLVEHDPDAVRAFLAEHDDVLAARVKREVRNKLETGRKNPRRGSSARCAIGQRPGARTRAAASGQDPPRSIAAPPASGS